MVLVYNYGRGIQFLSGAGGWQRWFFIVLALGDLGLADRADAAACPSDHLLPLGLALILGGAIGNLIDRVMHGAVVDFLDFHLGRRRHFPAFNVADSCDYFGVLLLFWHQITAVQGPGHD
jgi:signal peptidase II